MVQASGGVNSVSNSDGTLTISPTTGAVVASVASGGVGATQIAAGAVGATQLASSAVIDAKVSASAAIALSKLQASGVSSFAPADPTGTTSLFGTARKMMGLAIPFTPTKTGKLRLTAMGEILNTTAGDGAGFFWKYGTGTAPLNAATETGTTLGPVPASGVGQVDIDAIPASTRYPFCTVEILSGLTLSTAYWFDISLGARTGGTASIAYITGWTEEVA